MFFNEYMDVVYKDIMASAYQHHRGHNYKYFSRIFPPSTVCRVELRFRLGRHSFQFFVFSVLLRPAFRGIFTQSWEEARTTARYVWPIMHGHVRSFVVRVCVCVFLCTA